MDFYERAKMICENIPRGRVATYGQIALLCGKPRNARQVGYALNKGRLGDVPAYRVVSGSGVLSGASAFETYDMQKILLEAEGVEVTRTKKGWKTDLKRFGWRTTLEEAESFQEMFQKKNI